MGFTDLTVSCKFSFAPTVLLHELLIIHVSTQTIFIAPPPLVHPLCSSIITKAPATELSAKELVLLPGRVLNLPAPKDVRNVVFASMPTSISALDRHLRIAGQDGGWSKVFLVFDPAGMQQQVTLKRSRMASRRDIRTLLGEIFHGASIDSTVLLNIPGLASQLDVDSEFTDEATRMLQDHLGLIKLGDNEFSGCQYRYIRGGDSGLVNSPSVIDKAIAAHSTNVGRLYDLDLLGAGMHSTGLDYLQVAFRLRQLAESGHITLSPRNWVRSARIVQNPSSECGSDSIEATTELIYKDMHRRSEAWMLARRQVVELFTEDRCTTVGIAEYFGTELPGGRTRCERCSWCLTGRPLELNFHQRDDEIDTRKVRAVLEAVQDRDHPRFLARVAAGIMSPRVRQRNLQKSPVFRSLRHMNFDVSLSFPSLICFGLFCQGSADNKTFDNTDSC